MRVQRSDYLSFFHLRTAPSSPAKRFFGEYRLFWAFSVLILGNNPLESSRRDLKMV